MEITDEADQEAGAAKKNTEDVILLPREIASKVSRWLLTKGVSQTFFAKRVVNRSQGSFSDYITKAPNELPKTHGRGIWVTLNAFLNDPKQQAALIDEYKKGKYLFIVVVFTFFYNKVKYHCSSPSW